MRGYTISVHRDLLRGGIWLTALGLSATAALLQRGGLLLAARSTLEPFLTLAAIIGAGLIADRIGLFRVLARAVVPSAAAAPLAAARVLVFTALVSGTVNLDVAVVVAVPVALRVAERQRMPASRLAVAAALTANAASFLLPTSNLTTLLVLTRSPTPTWAYLQQSWAAWLLVTALTVAVLSAVVGRRPEAEGVSVPASSTANASPLTLLDLLPMFLIASAIRALLGGGVGIQGGVLQELSTTSLLAAAVNNLPAAAAVRVVGATGRWAAVLGLAIGPNLLLTGSVASLISRRIARDHRAAFQAGLFTLLGGALLPAQLLVALVGLHLTGAL